MKLTLSEEEVEIIEERLSIMMIEKQDKSLLSIIKKIRNQMDEQ